MKICITPDTGPKWLAQVQVEDDNFAILVDHIRDKDAMAEAWAEAVGPVDIGVAITSCIDRNSDSLAIPVPTQIITTRTVSQFRDQLSDAGLLTDIAIDAESVGISLLLITPQRLD
jgi:hypothetical protein